MKNPNYFEMKLETGTRKFTALMTFTKKSCYVQESKSTTNDSIFRLWKKHLILAVFLSASVLANAQMAGTYTIDPNGTGPTNFINFSTAVNALSVNGVNAAVQFNVAAGTYIEQIDIPTINGTSANNTVTFEGIDASTRILEFSSVSNVDAHTLRFNGSSFITFRNMNIKANGAAGIAVHFYSTVLTHNIRIEKCSLIALTTSSTNVKVVAATNSNVSSTGGACAGANGPVHSIYLDSNYIKEV